MHGESCDGLDLETVYFTAQDAIARIRAGNGPELLEVMTYRQCGHSKNDPRVYRTREEEARMAERDSIRQTAAALAARGCPQAAIDAEAQNARKTIAEAAEDAIQAPAGGIADATEGVFA